jgi:hypothetical protein
MRNMGNVCEEKIHMRKEGKYVGRRELCVRGEARCGECVLVEVRRKCEKRKLHQKFAFF